MCPRASPVESHIEGDQVVIRADLPWVDPKDTRMAEGDRVPYSGARLRVSLSHEMTPSDAEKAEKPTTYQKVRPVWLWTYDNPAPCPNKAPENPVVKPWAEPPGNCPGCGGEAMRKTGEGVKVIQPIVRKTRAT